MHTGCLYFIPSNAEQVLKIDPAAQEVSVVGPEFAGDFKWAGAVKAPDGQIYGIPYNSESVLRINPKDDTVAVFGHLVGEEKWYGGAVGEDGSIYGIPGKVPSVLSRPSKRAPRTILSRSVFDLNPEDQLGDTHLCDLW